MAKQPPLTFQISLSVLNHLGRNLYRSFATVLGEAISNSWDADARNVHIYVDRANGSLIIRDDGHGMSAKDIQGKFLRIGYSKRKDGDHTTDRGRPFVGRKGIGKLALLSCANRVTILSKTKTGKLVGGVIDNEELDVAITDDIKPQQYELGLPDLAHLKKFTRGLEKGTILYFEDIKEGIRSSLEHLRKIIALYFRFSLVDPTFQIHVNGRKVSFRDLNHLATNTEFLWVIGNTDDPFVENLKKLFKGSPKDHEIGTIEIEGIHGFVASVEKPMHLKVMATDERVGIDLFVNGRLRERDLLKHIPTARVAESYLYGQIHFDSLDDSEDRFTSSREGIVANDPKFQDFLAAFRKTILGIVEHWDEWRRKHRQEGDPENPKVSKKQRASENLYHAIAVEYGPKRRSENTSTVDQWFDELSAEASFNFESYAECFVSENLVRKLIKKKKTILSPEANAAVAKWKKVERESKDRGNISIEIRKGADGLSYLGMSDLANMVDKKDPIKEACLARDANEFKPIRDAVAHTALLTNPAKAKLSTVRENIRARINTLLK